MRMEIYISSHASFYNVPQEADRIALAIAHSLGGIFAASCRTTPECGNGWLEVRSLRPVEENINQLITESITDIATAFYDWHTT